MLLCTNLFSKSRFCYLAASYLQSWTKYWGKIEKSSKTGSDKKSLVSTFACFLTATAKV